MANNDTMAYSYTESITPDSAAVVTDGVEIERQATRMGLLIVATEEDTIDGEYTVIVETADGDDTSSGDWLENNLDSISFNAAGTYPIELTTAVLDKVRARIECTGATYGALSFELQWLCDTQLTGL